MGRFFTLAGFLLLLIACTAAPDPVTGNAVSPTPAQTRPSLPTATPLPTPTHALPASTPTLLPTATDAPLPSPTSTPKSALPTLTAMPTLPSTATPTSTRSAQILTRAVVLGFETPLAQGDVMTELFEP